MRDETTLGEGSAAWTGDFGTARGEHEDEDYFDMRTKDILVIQQPELKVSISATVANLILFAQFLLLEFDPEICEFGTYCLFNLDHSEELKITGKRFPKQGLLRTISAESTQLSGFGFLADDTVFCWVQLQQVQDAAAAHASAQMQQQQSGSSQKQPSLQKTQSFDLLKRQSSQWTDMGDPDEPQAQGVLSSIQLNEKYMNAMAGDPSRVTIE